MCDDVRRARWPRGRDGRVWVILGALALLGGCGGTPMDLLPDNFGDGAYRIGLRSPVIVDPVVTPNWMRIQPTFDIVKLDGVVTVSPTSDPHVSPGPAQLVEETEDGGWVVQLSWTGLDDGNHYWEMAFSADGCTMAEAVDADLGIGPDGIWRVALRGCLLEAR